jgi:hypothetical protein
LCSSQLLFDFDNTKSSCQKRRSPRPVRNPTKCMMHRPLRSRGVTATQPLPPPPRLDTVSKRAYKKARKEILAESTKSPQPGTFPFSFSVADWLATPGGKRTYDSVHPTATHAAARLRKFAGLGLAPSQLKIPNVSGSAKPLTFGILSSRIASLMERNSEKMQRAQQGSPRQFEGCF